MWTFTKDTALSEQGRVSTWRVRIYARTVWVRFIRQVLPTTKGTIAHCIMDFLNYCILQEWNELYVTNRLKYISTL
jgi:hypothetical protein